jgi:hypothetical protein
MAHYGSVAVHIARRPITNAGFRGTSSLNHEILLTTKGLEFYARRWRLVRYLIQRIDLRPLKQSCYFEQLI